MSSPNPPSLELLAVCPGSNDSLSGQHGLHL